MGWFFDSDVLRRHVVEYFSSLYTVDNYLTGSFPFRGRFSNLKENALSDLMVEVTLEEVQRSVFNRSPLKAPGVDDLHAKFYQVN